MGSQVESNTSGSGIGGCMFSWREMKGIDRLIYPENWFSYFSIRITSREQNEI
jgi:hypothetical protein